VPVGSVIQPFAVTVIAGHLTVSCTHGVAQQATAVTACRMLTMPPVHLDGRQQTRSMPMHPLYVCTGRGTATSGWSLSLVMVPTGSTLNPDPACAGVQGFCDSRTGTGAGSSHATIGASDLALDGYGCRGTPTNSNPTPTTSAGGSLATPLVLCNARQGTSGGEFIAKSGTFSLTVPATAYRGVYYATVECVLAST
jgi:hypothetical protein